MDFFDTFCVLTLTLIATLHIQINPEATVGSTCYYAFGCSPTEECYHNQFCRCKEYNYQEGKECFFSLPTDAPIITGYSQTYNSFTVFWDRRPDTRMVGYGSSCQLNYNGLSSPIRLMVSSGYLQYHQTTHSPTGLRSNTFYNVTISRTMHFKLIEMETYVSNMIQLKTESSHNEPCTSSNDCARFPNATDDLICYTKSGGSSVCLCPDGSYYNGHLPCSPLNVLIPSFSLSSDLTSITVTLTNKTAASAVYTSTYRVQLNPGNIVYDLTSDTTRIAGLTEGTTYRVTVTRSLILTGVGRVQTTDQSSPLDCSTKVPYGNKCISNGTCFDINTSCYGGRCLCDPGHYWRESYCRQIRELAPGYVTALTMDTTTVSVSWAPLSHSSFVSGYRVDATPTDSIDPDPPAVEVPGGGVISTTLTGLQPGTQYRVTVEAKSTNDGRVEYVSGNFVDNVTEPARIIGLDEVNSNFSAPDMTIAFPPAVPFFLSYTVTLRGETVGYYKHVSATRLAAFYFAVFSGVTSGNYYNIEVVTNSLQNSQSKPFTDRRRAFLASSHVMDFSKRSVTSRSVLVNWKRPEIPNGRLFEYSLEIAQDGVCISRIVFNCTLCSRNSSFFADRAPLCSSSTIIEISEDDMNDDSHIVQQNVTFLDPDTSYTMQAVAYNEEGRGRVTVPLLIHTKSEPARVPKAVAISKITSSTLTVSWVPETPRPGNTSYVLELLERNLDDDQFSLLKKVTVLGYATTHFNVQDLSSFWEYKLAVLSKSEVPPASASVLTGVVNTLESAPTRVVELQALKIPGVYHKVRLSWECPPQKDGRNGVILSATVKYETDTTADVVTRKSGENAYRASQDCSWDVEIDVTAGFNYTFTVFISNSFKGAQSVIQICVPEGPPPLNDGDQPLIQIISGGVSRSSISVHLCTVCVFNNQNGGIVRTGMLVCRLGHCPINEPGTKQASYYDSLTNWDKAKGVAFTSVYRATDNTWIDGATQSQSDRFVLGGDDCSSIADQTRFCNGPLPKDTYRMWLFACTSAGCAEGSHVEFTLKEKDTALSSTTVGAIAASIAVGVVALVIAVVIYIKVIRPRSLRQKSTRYMSDTSNNDHTYDEVSGGNRLSVIQDGRPELDYYNMKDNPPRSENTYDQLKVYSNQGHHGYGKIKVTQT